MSTYRDAQTAFLDLIDNAVDDRVEGDTLIIRVTVAKNQLSIFNQGGDGLDVDGLEHWLEWGFSEKIGKIGHYGVGGKAAMGFLARSMQITCSAKRQDIEYKVADKNWDVREETFKELPVDERKTPVKEGYFRVRLTDLKREVSAAALISRLGDIYAPLLRDGSVEITVNGKRVLPVEIEFLETDPNLLAKHSRVETRLGDKFIVKVGILAEGQRIKPGVRCYYRGRLIEDEQFFGFPTPAIMPQASRLIGEAHLDFVPVTTNKSSFIHSSVEWESVGGGMKSVLEPWYQKLAKLRIEQKTQVEAYEKELLKKAKRVVEHVLATTGLITKKDLPGESGGRMPPTTGITEPRPPGPPRKPTGPKEGETAPQLGATVGEESIKRWGAFHRWDTVSMGTLDKRCEVIEDNSRQILKVNSDYPLYQAAKKAGEEALEIYMAETAVMKICEIVVRQKSVDDYVDLRDWYLSRCGEVLRLAIREKRTVKQRKSKAWK